MTIGREDNFLNDGLENASPSQALLNWQISKGGTNINAGFDNSTPNSWFSHSFIGLNQTNKGGTLIGATIQLGIKALVGFSKNDNLLLGFINSNTDNFIYA